MFTRISLPICRTSLATAAILSFIFSWNNFIFALILTGPDRRTLPVAVFNFIHVFPILVPDRALTPGQ